jgi:hypothetical protein
MRRVTRFLVLVSIGALAACASQPQQQTPKAAPAGAPVTETPDTPQHVLAQANFALLAVQAGFSPESRNGTMLYCEHAPSLGSRIPHIRCFTPHQVRVILQMREQQRQALSGATAAPGCGTNGQSC